MVVGLLVAALPFVLFGADSFRHVGRVCRNVHAGSVDLSNLDENAARHVLTERAEALLQEVLSVRVAEGTETATLGALGVQFDVEATLSRALAQRREPGARRLRSWFAGLWASVDVGMVANVETSVCDHLIEQWEHERVPVPFEGAVVVKDGQPSADLPRVGQAVDSAEAHRSLHALVVTGERTWTLPLRERLPRRTAELVAAALVQAQQLVSAPVALYVDRVELAGASGPVAVPAFHSVGSPVPSDTAGAPDEQRITVYFSREQLLAALRTRLVDEPLGIEVYVDATSLDPILGDLRQAVERPSVEPHFEIGPQERPFAVQGWAGRVVKADAVAKALVLAASAPERTGKLPIELGAAPTSTLAELESLGIVGLVANFTTQHPCCTPRVDNIHRIADLTDGVLVKPGEVFSLNRHIGERTVAKGFKAAPTIVSGEMEDTIGGGISQFATTLFNAAFYGGYDIVERKPHSFYIARYPMGHEATLSFPKPDLAIRNDTNAGLLIRCFYSRTAITVKLYGNNGGRHVRRKVSPVRDVVQPPVEYLADPTLKPGVEKNQERGQVGWTVTVSRVLDFADGTSRTDERKVTYQPRVRRVRVHPCKIPRGQLGHTGDPCPEPDAGAEAEAHPAVDAPLKVPGPGEGANAAALDDEG